MSARPNPLRCRLERARARPIHHALQAGALASALVVLGGWSFFDPFHEWIEKGNRDAKRQKADEALGHYDAAAKEMPSSPIPDFNRGIVLAREGKSEEAKQAFESAQASADAGIAADAHYNNGNLLLEQKDTKGAIEQYLRSLDLDPTDPDARRNLEIAMRQLEQQQQQQQQQQDQSQKDEKKDDSQDQKQQPDDSEKKDDKQPQGEQPKPEEPKPNEEPQPPDSSSEPGQEPPPDPESQQPMEGRLSREDAARLLNAIQNDELKVLRKLEEKKGQPVEVGNDW